MQRHSEILSDSAFQALAASAAALERDAHGPKVLALADGSYLKLFRRKHRLSRARLLPYSTRFARNAARLARLGIATVEVTARLAIPSIDRTAVRYRPLAGETLAALAARGPLDTDAARHLGAFIARLHQHGVLFRSLHLGNIVRTGDGSLGLIDVADLRFRRRLGWRARARNFRHLLRRPQDRTALAPVLDGLLAAYFDAADLPPAAAGRLRRRVCRVAELRQ